jgi:hypothetical protein
MAWVSLCCNETSRGGRHERIQHSASSVDVPLGRFGVAVEDLGLAGPKVDDVFWACHHPAREPELRLTKCGECEQCPFWEEAARLRAAC